MSKTTKTIKRTRETARTAAPAPAQVPLLLHTMGLMAMWDGNEPAELPNIVPMMPSYMQAVRERRTAEGPEQGVVSVDSIVEATFEAQLARATSNDPSKYWYDRHTKFMAAVGPMDIAPGLFGDEYLDELRHGWGEIGFFVGMAYAYYFMVEAGVIGGER